MAEAGQEWRSPCLRETMSPCGIVGLPQRGQIHPISMRGQRRGSGGNYPFLPSGCLRHCRGARPYALHSLTSSSPNRLVRQWSSSSALPALVAQRVKRQKAWATSSSPISANRRLHRPPWSMLLPTTTAGHVSGVGPIRDIEIIDAELALADLRHRGRKA